MTNRAAQTRGQWSRNGCVVHFLNTSVIVSARALSSSTEQPPKLVLD